jgi:uncharacterized membrane protein (DUF485 family)
MAAWGTARHWRRRVAALLMLAGTVLLAAFVYLIGYFSDWSGQHRVPIETTVGAVVILVVGSLASVWILRTRR